MLPDFCRAVAIAALGPQARFEFKTLDLPEDDKALDDGDFDVLFLTEEEIARKRTPGAILAAQGACLVMVRHG